MFVSAVLGLGLFNEAWWRERSADGVFLLNQSGAGTTVSRNDQAQAGHEGESEAKKELVPCKRAERCARRITQAGRPG